MRAENYLKIEQDERDKYVYRIIPYHRLLEIFESKSLVLLKPSMWEDPFENYLMKSNFTHNGEPVSFSGRDEAYGLCWARTGVSDALWRIYSPDSSGVRIKAKISSLGTALYGVGDLPELNAFVGKVSYHRMDPLLEEVRRLAPSLIDSRSSGHPHSLLLKRNAFSHEKEVRLIFIDRGSLGDGKLLKVPVNSHELIESVLLDPRAPYETLHDYRQHLRGVYGYRGSVNRSELYVPPEPLTLELS